MERMCSNCHAVMGAEMEGDWCPACGGAVIERKGDGVIEKAAVGQDSKSRAEIDHRGIVLPRRHALGGVITPQ
jgi:RNA polymerase subunit RPABC4/transcription elongation factor Spt4